MSAISRKAAFFDLDGTLAVHNLPPAPEDADAIRRFRAAGHLAFLCTGRASGYIYPSVLDIGFDGVVASAGAHVTLDGKILYRRTVSPEVIESAGIRREDVLAVGDSANDLDMLRYAGIGAAMGNASDEVKAAADWVTGTLAQHGAAQALLRFENM